MDSVYLEKICAMMRARNLIKDVKDLELLQCFYHIKDTKKLIYNTVVKKITTAFIRDLIPKILELESNYCLIVYDVDVTPHIKDISDKIKNEIAFSLWSTSELLIDIPNHVFQPKFTPLTSIEAAKIIKKYGIYLPIIKRSDPLCRYYDWPVKTIIKFERPDETSYRIVAGG